MATCGHTNLQVRRSFGQTSVQPAQIIFGVLDEIQRARCQIVPKSSTQNPPLAPKRDDLLSIMMLELVDRTGVNTGLGRRN
jgi:hypothetical protein